MQRGLPQKRKLPSVEKVLLVSSAKGGVGKSTVAVNLAAALSSGLHLPYLPANFPSAPPPSPLRVGLLDLDLFGPSVPKLLQLENQPPPLLTEQNRLIPLVNHGVKSMSMGYLLPPNSDKAVVAWRGLMVMKATQQLLFDTDWGGLDVLVVDLPPGTGDVQLTLAQHVVVDGAIVVTTPQDVALVDVVKGVRLWQKMDVPILGVVANMSHFVCPGCSEVHEIFGRGSQGGVEGVCERLGVRVLGRVPIEKGVCEDGDRGVPTVVRDGGGRVARCFGEVGGKVVGMLWGGMGEEKKEE